jgi:hypothetical protein
MLYQYLRNPEQFWPEEKHRNIIKFKNKLRKTCIENPSLKDQTNKEIAEFFWAIALIRNVNGCQHIYINNIGSSGSHWLETMLAFAEKIKIGGEIYLPNSIRKCLDNFTKEKAALFLDAVYFAHIGYSGIESIGSIITNSAHYSDPTTLSRYSSNPKTVLLIRDPLEIALSRTFRKDEYRNYVAPKQSDQEYLEKNIHVIHKFYSKALQYDYGVIIRYEDLVNNPSQQLKKLKIALNLNFSDQRINEAINSTSKEAISKNILEGAAPVTNLYIKERHNYSTQLFEIAQKRLEKLRITLKYM